MIDSILEWASLISAIVGCMVTLLLVVIEITKGRSKNGRLGNSGGKAGKRDRET